MLSTSCVCFLHKVLTFVSLTAFLFLMALVLFYYKSIFYSIIRITFDNEAHFYDTVIALMGSILLINKYFNDVPGGKVDSGAVFCSGPGASFNSL